tara:strand:+ start:304 stop:516 length:213 start_codon:yes stop_codon:yes gene_type:complete
MITTATDFATKPNFWREKAKLGIDQFLLQKSPFCLTGQFCKRNLVQHLSKEIILYKRHQEYGGYVICVYH